MFTKHENIDYFIHKTKDFLEDEASTLREERIQRSMEKFRVESHWMFFENDMVLYAEVRNVEI